MNVLLLTNMGKTSKNPICGEFVRRQYRSLRLLENDDFNVDYFEMPETTSTSSSIVRYLNFLFVFIKNCIFTTKKYDLIHIHFFFPTIVLAIFYKVFRNHRLKIIATFHGNDVYHYSNFSWWYRKCFKFVDHAVFVSENLKNRFFKTSTPSNVLCAGVLPDFNVTNANESKLAEYTFIFVGSLEKNKGVFRLIALINSLTEHYKVAVVGTGASQEEIIKLSANENVDYYPFLQPDELATLYKRSKWLINLSYNESFGLVISEAMSCGVPVIATETDGALSQIVPYSNGIILSQQASLSEDILAIITNTSDESYQQFCDNAKQSSEIFSIEYVTNQIKLIYEKYSK